jgi:hypothetical protein
MKALNKTQTWTKVVELLELNNVKDGEVLYTELKDLLAPKTAGSKLDENPPKLNKKGEIIEVYCIWHKEYELVEEFAKGRKEGTYHYECKEASKMFHQYTKLINNIKVEIESLTNDVMDGNIDVEDAKATRLEYLADIAKLESDRKAKVSL